MRSWWPLPVSVPLEWCHASAPWYHYSEVHLLGWLRSLPHYEPPKTNLEKKSNWKFYSIQKTRTKQLLPFLLGSSLISWVLSSHFYPGQSFDDQPLLLQAGTCPRFCRIIKLHFRLSSFHDSFAHLRPPSVWDQSARAARLCLGSHPRQALLLSSCPGIWVSPAPSVPTVVGSWLLCPFLLSWHSFLLVPMLYSLAPVSGYVLFLGSQPLLISACLTKERLHEYLPSKAVLQAEWPDR